MLRPMEWAAFDEAERLEHDWVGPEHALLAVVLGPEDDPAVRALRDSGLKASAVERQLGLMDSAHRGTEELKIQLPGLSPNPAFNRVLGRAEGLAAGLGDPEVQAVHVLLALLWDRHRWQFLETHGASRDGVLAALRHLGVKIPAVSPPPLERVPAWTQQVNLPAERLDPVLPLLLERHPPSPDGPIWGFNYRGDGLARIDAEDGIDLEAIVTEALAGEEE